MGAFQKKICRCHKICEQKWKIIGEKRFSLNTQSAEDTFKVNTAWFETFTESVRVSSLKRVAPKSNGHFAKKIDFRVISCIHLRKEEMQWPKKHWLAKPVLWHYFKTSNWTTENKSRMERKDEPLTKKQRFVFDDILLNFQQNYIYPPPPPKSIHASRYFSKSFPEAWIILHILASQKSVRLHNCRKMRLSIDSEDHLHRKSSEPLPDHR